MYAIKGMKPDNVKLLLNYGADAEKTDKDGKTFGVLLLSRETVLAFRTELLLPGTTSLYNGKSKILPIILFVLSMIITGYSHFQDGPFSITQLDGEQLKLFNCYLIAFGGRIRRPALASSHPFRFHANIIVPTSVREHFWKIDLHKTAAHKKLPIFPHFCCPSKTKKKNGKKRYKGIMIQLI